MAKIRYIKDKDNEVVLPVTHERGVLDSNGVNLETKLAGKQATLVSGTNIKTINSQSLLGSGNITLNGGNINYTGEDGEMAVVSGDSVDSCLSGLDSVLYTVEQQKEARSNKVTSLSSSSTDTQYPSAKAVWELVIDSLNEGDSTALLELYYPLDTLTNEY